MPILNVRLPQFQSNHCIHGAGQLCNPSRKTIVRRPQGCSEYFEFVIHEHQGSAPRTICLYTESKTRHNQSHTRFLGTLFGSENMGSVFWERGRWLFLTSTHDAGVFPQIFSSITTHKVKLHVYFIQLSQTFFLVVLEVFDASFSSHWMPL